MEASFLVLAKRRPGLDECVAQLERLSSHVNVVLGERGEPLPHSCFDWEGDVLISYLSPWVIPARLLRKARIAALNFHPGPPEYPGIGCTNFAIYHGAREYGVTAHHMEEKVDTGRIIAVRRFPIFDDDTVFTVTQRAYEHLAVLFQSVFTQLTSSGTLPESHEKWARKPYARRELETLCKITLGMSREDIERRIKATTYPGMPGAYVEIYGHRFEYVEGERSAMKGP